MDALKKAVQARKRQLVTGDDEGEEKKPKDLRKQGEESDSADEETSSSSSSSECSEDEEVDSEKADERIVRGTDEVDEDSRESSAKRTKPNLDGTEEGRVLSWIDKILALWIDDLAKLPEEIVRTSKGRVETSAARECEEQLEPLRQALQERTLDKTILARLVAIVKECDQREYRRAFDEYIQLTIGNSPWPIGVTMVGIHARSGREKIAESKVQHIMKDDTTRAYLTSVKRLMTRCQSLYPPSAPSKRMN